MSEKQIPTPRTDAEEMSAIEVEVDTTNSGFVPVKVARELEQALTTEKQEHIDTQIEWKREQIRSRALQQQIDEMDKRISQYERTGRV